MSDMGIPKPLVRWMAAFLCDRAQCVKIGSTLSANGNPNGGIPQGTLAGPKGFLVQINDFVTVCPTFKYVDDSTIFEICNKNSASIIQHAAEEAHAWSDANDMIINADKTKELLICFCRDSGHHNAIPNITIDGNSIERVTSSKVLGITISADLTWNDHIEAIVKKASKRVYMLYQLKRSGVAETDIVTIYTTVVRPVVEYSCQVWHTSLPKYLSNKLESIQKRALRVAFPGQPYEDILQRTGLTTLHKRRDKLCLDYFSKIKSPSHKINHVLPLVKESAYNLRKSTPYPIPIAKTNRYKNSFIPWCLSKY